MAKKKKDIQVAILVNSSGVEHEFSVSQALAILRSDIKKYNRLKNWQPLKGGSWEFEANELIRTNRQLESNKSDKES